MSIGVQNISKPKRRNRLECDADLRVIALLHNANTSLQMSAYSVFLETREPAGTFTGGLGGRRGEGKRKERMRDPEEEQPDGKRDENAVWKTIARFTQSCGIPRWPRRKFTTMHAFVLQHRVMSLHRGHRIRKCGKRERERKKAIISSFQFYICTRICTCSLPKNQRIRSWKRITSYACFFIAVRQRLRLCGLVTSCRFYQKRRSLSMTISGPTLADFQQLRCLTFCSFTDCLQISGTKRFHRARGEVPSGSCDVINAKEQQLFLLTSRLYFPVSWCWCRFHVLVTCDRKWRVSISGRETYRLWERSEYTMYSASICITSWIRNSIA